jgi:hypothetical protein
VYHALTPEDHPRVGTEPANYRPLIALLAAVLAALVGVAVCAAAILVPAPTGAIPFVVAISAGAPLLAGWEIRSAVTSRRRFELRGEKALGRLRSQLERLPETEHPLGL